jgi:hypothetical protein
MYKLYPTMSESPSQDCSTYVIMPREYLGVLAEKAVAGVLSSLVSSRVCPPPKKTTGRDDGFSVPDFYNYFKVLIFLFQT